MIEDPRLTALDELASASDPDEGRIHDAALEIGADLRGLRSLVDHYRDSNNPLVVVRIAFALSHACNDWDPPDPRLSDVVLDFLDTARKTNDAGALVTTLNALMGLHINRLLRGERPGDRMKLGEFLLHSLDQTNRNVRGSCLDLIAQLWYESVLPRFLAPEAADALRKRLARLAVEEGDEFDEDLAAFREFWEPR